jgi:hypothetical protein
MRATLLLPLGVLLLAFAAWLLLGPTGPGSAPSSVASPATPSEATPGHDREIATKTTPSPPRVIEIPPAQTTASSKERQSLARGRGLLRLEMTGPPSIVADPFVLGLVPEDPDNPAPARTLVRSPERFHELEPIDLPAGSYRVFVVSGPGDPRGCEVSKSWTIDEFDDVVQVIADQTAKEAVKITTAVEAAPPRGVARISGFAFLDGAPATNCFVTTGPLTRSRVVRVSPDGSFDLGEVEAGSARVQLSEPADGIVRDAFLARLAWVDVAPAPGEALGIRLEARTGRCDVTAIDDQGQPVAGTLEVLGVPAFVIPGFGSELGNTSGMNRHLSSAAPARIERIPAGRIGLIVRRHGFSSDPVWIDLRPGATEVVRVPMRTLTEVRVDVDWDSFGAPERAGASVRFRGPTSARISVGRVWRGTAYLLPGDYEVEVQIRPLQLATIAAQPLRVEAGEPQAYTARAAR